MAIVKQRASFRIDQPAEVMFPLFSAEGEKLWVPGWDYENIMDSTGLHEDYVFLTAAHHHAHGDKAADKTIWLVKRFQPADFYVQFYRVEPGDKVGIVTVQCNPLSVNKTEVEVAYEYIGLSEKGDDFIAGYTAEAHEHFIAHWAKLLEQYFASKPYQISRLAKKQE